MFRTNHSTTTVLFWTTVISFIIAVVIALAAAIITSAVALANAHGLGYEPDVAGLLVGSCLFLVVTAFGAAATWVAHNTDFSLRLPEVEKPVLAAHLAYEAVTA